MRRYLCVLSALILAGNVAGQEPKTIDVWPGKAPGDDGKVGPEKVLPARPTDKKKIIRITDVSRPTLTIHRPPKDKDTGAAVVICPGGGYHILAWDLEGEEVAAWLNRIGVTGIVLKYRVPRRPGETKGTLPLGPLQDGQRAMRLVRSRAKEWGLDPERIGILGFSAGGNLAARVATRFDRPSYDKIDAVDGFSSRPDFAVLIYPAYLAKDGKLVDDFPVTKKTPPMFFAHAFDDGVTPENSALAWLALKRAGVPAELHLYASGGHGFGLRPSDQPCSTWPERCTDWMRRSGLLKSPR